MEIWVPIQPLILSEFGLTSISTSSWLRSQIWLSFLNSALNLQSETTCFFHISLSISSVMITLMLCIINLMLFLSFWCLKEFCAHQITILIWKWRPSTFNFKIKSNFCLPSTNYSSSSITTSTISYILKLYLS